MEEYELEHTGCARQETVFGARRQSPLRRAHRAGREKTARCRCLRRHSSARAKRLLHNCPALSDVRTRSPFCGGSDAAVPTGDTLTVCADGMTRCDIPHSLMREMRSSIVFLGAILSRCGEARLSFPGGCELGPRPIDLHLEALRKLGAEIRENTAACCALRPAGCAAGSSRCVPKRRCNRKTCCSPLPAPKRAQRCSQTPRVSRRLRISPGT